jgi:gamma-glutamyltranspeptidase/glutathione hydrolase
MHKQVPAGKLQERHISLRLLFAPCLFALLGLAASCRHHETLPRSLESSVVAAPEAQAAQIGGEILRRGGNAVDAAIAVQFAIAVTNAIGTGIGGGGFMLIHDPVADEVVALDYRETAPADAHRDMFLDETGEPDAQLSVHSPLASGVPGTVRGMAALHERYGSLPWAELVQPAIDLADNGFRIDPWTANKIQEYGQKFALVDPRFREHIEFQLYFREGADRMTIPDLAETLRRIAEQGADEFYTGRTSELIIEEMQDGGGLISAADLASYRPVWREPLAGDYRGYRIVSMPLPSSGGVILIEFLNMLEEFDPRPLQSPAQVHLFAEIAKRAFADRAEYLGDPAFTDVPVEVLTDKAYARSRVKDIDPARRTDPDTIEAGDVMVEFSVDGQTTHFSIVDRDGLAVSNTTTLNTGYGSGIVVDGAGFLLNSQMNDFSAKPGVPNVYGVTGSAANEIAPGKRPLSSMTPTMVFDPEGRLMLVLGSPGGSTIITTVLSVILNVVDYELSLAQAVDLPRFHHQWPPVEPGTDPITVETDARYRLPGATLDALLELGYTLGEIESLGDVQAVQIDGHRVTGVFDRRRTGGVVSVEER